MPGLTASGIVHRRLFMDSIVVSARRDHPLRAKEADFEDLARAQWIVPNPNVLTRMKLTELFHARGLDEPLIQIESDFHPVYHRDGRPNRSAELYAAGARAGRESWNDNEYRELSGSAASA